MLFSISGTHCNGKSSIFNELRDELSNLLNFQFIEGPTRKLREQGFVINKSEENYDATQLACLKYDLDVIESSKKFKGITISERGLIDTYVYTKYLHSKGKVSDEVFEKVQTSYFEYRSKYAGYILPTHFDLPYENDGVRDGDIEFREDIDKMFHEESVGINFFWIAGTMYVRISYIYGVLKFKTKSNYIDYMNTRKYYDSKYPPSKLLVK